MNEAFELVYVILSMHIVKWQSHTVQYIQLQYMLCFAH